MEDAFGKDPRIKAHKSEQQVFLILLLSCPYLLPTTWCQASKLAKKKDKEDQKKRRQQGATMMLVWAYLVCHECNVYSLLVCIVGCVEEEVKKRQEEEAIQKQKLRELEAAEEEKKK